MKTGNCKHAYDFYFFFYDIFGDEEARATIGLFIGIEEISLRNRAKLKIRQKRAKTNKRKLEKIILER